MFWSKNTVRSLSSVLLAVKPEGIFLWVAADDEDEEQELLKRVARWT